MISDYIIYDAYFFPPSSSVADKCQGAIVDLVRNSNHNTVIGSNRFILPSIFDPVSKKCTGTSSTAAAQVNPNYSGLGTYGGRTGANGFCSICSAQGNAALYGGQQLNSQSLPSSLTASGRTLTMQTDGNLVLKDSSANPLFSSNTWQGYSSYNMTLKMQVKLHNIFVCLCF
jgi:hypothetical protein